MSLSLASEEREFKLEAESKMEMCSFYFYHLIINSTLNLLFFNKFKLRILNNNEGVVSTKPPTTRIFL